MRMPYWLLRLLPMWEYVCPRCRREVPKNSHECPYCGERFPLALRVPPSFLKDPKKLEEYVHKHILPRVSEFERNYLTKYFTVLFSDGFESGDFSAWTSSGGAGTHTESVESSNPHHGTYNAKFDLTGSGAESWAKKTFTAAPIIYSRVYYKFISGLPTTTGNKLYLTQVDAGTYLNSVMVFVDKTATGTRWGTWTFISGSDTYNYESGESNPTTGIHYCVEVLRDVTNSRVKLWVDGNLLIDAAKSHSGNSNEIYVGQTNHSYAGQTVVTVDCVVVADAYIGEEGGAILKEVTDSIGLADSVLRNKTMTITDAVGLTDASPKTDKTFSIADAIGLADAVLANKTLTITDAISLVDMILANKTLTIADSITLADVIEVYKAGVLKEVTDTISLSDSVLANKTFSISDTIALAETIVIMKILQVSDSIQLTDAISTPTRVLQVLDSIGLLDSLNVNKTLIISDTIALVELVSKWSAVEEVPITVVLIVNNKVYPLFSKAGIVTLTANKREHELS